MPNSLRSTAPGAAATVKARLPRTRANGEVSIYQVTKRRMVCDPDDPTQKIVSEVLVWRATFTVEMHASPRAGGRPYARKIVGESPSKTDELRQRVRVRR